MRSTIVPCSSILVALFAALCIALVPGSAALGAPPLQLAQADDADDFDDLFGDDADLLGDEDEDLFEDDFEDRREPEEPGLVEEPRPEEEPGELVEGEPGGLAEEEVAEPDFGAPLEPSGDVEVIVILGAETAGAIDLETADSVASFDASDLTALGVQDVEDLAAFTPNLEIVTSGATTPTFFIRGVGLNDFNANSTGAVAVYQDDVAINAPALQLSTLFDTENVNILRGPVGSGQGRNASAGAIKIYSRMPSGEFGGYLNTSLGNYNGRDFEGAVEMPLWQDMLAGRLAFRYSERDGFATNDCGNAPPDSRRIVNTAPGFDTTEPPASICGESVRRNRISILPTGLDKQINDLDNWAARGSLVFDPGLASVDMEWRLIAQGSRRDELARLGQSYGTGQTVTDDMGNVEQVGLLGGRDGARRPLYRPIEVKNRLRRVGDLGPTGNPDQASGDAKRKVASELADDLDTRPWRGDYNRTGDLRNDTWSVSLRGEMDLPNELLLTSNSSYVGYDRENDVDLDFSPNELFEVDTEDEGWQVYQSLALEGEVGDLQPLSWELGAYYLQERLDVEITNRLGVTNPTGVGERDYNQKMWSFAPYLNVAWDFAEDFTLDGGGRYNWEQKSIDYSLITSGIRLVETKTRTWNAATGFVRLTYRFREDTHAYWRYTRGWKPGTFNATSSPTAGVTPASPEELDAWEVGLRGSWWDDRLSLGFAFFYYDYEDYQLFTSSQQFDAQPEFVILNAKGAENYGAEVDLTVEPWFLGKADLRFGWLESKFLDFVQEQQVTTIENGQVVIITKELNNTGNRLLNSPRFKVSFTLEQGLEIGRYGTLTARYDGTWTDDTYYDATEGRGIPNQAGQLILPQNTIGQRQYWLHNLWFSYKTPAGNIEIAGWVRNLDNKAYKTYSFDASTFQRTTIHFVGDPRTYGASLNIRF